MTKRTTLPLFLLKTLLRRYKAHYDQVIVDRDNEIQMLRQELEIISGVINRN